MRDETDWYSYYKVLGVSTGSDWKTVQTAYRRLAQASHPDRFESGTAKQKTAESNIIRINEAYRALSGFYRKHGRLPGQRIGNFSRPAAPGRSPTQTAGTEATTESSTAEAPLYTWHSKRKPGAFRRYSKPILKSALLIGICLAIYHYYYLPDDYPLVMTDTQQGPRMSASVVDKDSTHPPASATDSIFYTPGSTMGEVHAIQGNPSRTMGSTWYYGRSYVTFEDGLLKSWNDDPDNPLKIRPVDPESSKRTAHSRLISRFTVGSTKADVLAVQGQPTSRSESRWDYGFSKIYFDKHNRVVKWSESPLQPLKAEKIIR